MKKLLPFLLPLFFIPFILSSQPVDTATVVMQVDSLIQVSRVLTGQNQFGQALEVNAVAEQLALEKLGEETASYGTCCFNRGRILFFKGDYVESEKWYKQAKTLRAHVLGTAHEEYGLVLNNIGNIRLQTGNYQEAEALYLEAKAIWEKSVGKMHQYYSWSLNNLANIYRATGQYQKAESIFLEALSIKEKLMGRENNDYATTVYNLGITYHSMQDYEKSELFYQESLLLYERTVGKLHPQYANCLNSLGILYADMQDYEKAESYYLESIAISKEIMGENHPDYAKLLGNVGDFYLNAKQFEKAESFLNRSLAILEKSIGRNNIYYAKIMRSQGLLHLSMNQYKRAEAIFIELNSIWNVYIDKNQADYGFFLLNYAYLFHVEENYQQAEKLYLELKILWANILGTENLHYAWVLNNLGFLYIDMGDYEKAESNLQEAIYVKERIAGIDHVDYAFSLSNLGVLYKVMGEFNKAEQTMLKAKEILKRAKGDDDFDMIFVSSSLSITYIYLNEYGKAKDQFEELGVVTRKAVAQALFHLSEEELRNFLYSFSRNQDEILSCTHIPAAGLTGISFNSILFYKGFLLGNSNRIKRVATSNTFGAEKFTQLQLLHRRLAREYAKPIAERKDVEELETQANDVEKDLAGTVAGYGEAIRQVNWQEVQQQLRPDEAAIEFVHYQYYNPNPTDSVMYAALLLRPGYSQPVFVPLFEEKQLLLLLSKDEATSSSTFFAQAYSRGITPAKNENYQGLYELVWQPLDTLLTGVKTVYYSPSGAIHRLNLSAIAVDKINTLTDRYQLVRLGSTRSLVVADTISSYANNSAALFGGIEYEADTTAADRDSTYLLANLAGSLSFANAERGVDQRGESWGALSGAKDEVTRIDKLLKSRQIKSQLWSDREATEEVFKNLGQTGPSPRIVHLATHGFFFPDPQAEIHSHGLGIQEPVFKLSEHPMIRSGLVLAGGNYAWKTGKSPHPDGEDGILTAYEISQMNLSNTELVVLSACETGLGDIEGNEGVYGLQRAFKIAGARYLIMSLWQVPDRETSVFMTRFYEHWLEERRPIPEAFQQTQQEMRRRFPNPYQWGGFILME